MFSHQWTSKKSVKWHQAHSLGHFCCSGASAGWWPANGQPTPSARQPAFGHAQPQPTQPVYPPAGQPQQAQQQPTMYSGPPPSMPTATQLQMQAMTPAVKSQPMPNSPAVCVTQSYVAMQQQQQQQPPQHAVAHMQSPTSSVPPLQLGPVSSCLGLRFIIGGGGGCRLSMK